VRKEGAGDVPAPLVSRQTSLRRRPSCSREQRLDRKVPAGGQLAREPLGGVVAALQLTVRISWNEYNAHGIRSGQGLMHDCRRPPGEPAQAALLPRRYDRAQTVVVRQCRPSTRKSEPPARTLRTAAHGPRSRTAATRAERRLDTAQGPGAAVADLRSGKKADEAALRQKEIQHVTTLGRHM
jgi:hypothetical protein